MGPKLFHPFNTKLGIRAKNLGYRDVSTERRITGYMEAHIESTHENQRVALGVMVAKGPTFGPLLPGRATVNITVYRASGHS